jgi:hypothetical protein
MKKVEPTANKSGIMSDKSRQDPPKGKPIYVKSKNDPRYKAFQDSLVAYKTLDKYKNIPKNIPFKKEDEKNIRKIWASNLEPLARDFSNPRPLTDRSNGNIERADYFTPTKYKEPQRQVIVKEQEKRKPVKTIQNNLKPEGLIQSDTKLNTDIKGLKPTVKTPKYYNIQENINQPFGGSQTNYRSSDLKNITSPDDLGPGNTRKITPIYQTKEDMVQTPPKKNERIVKSLRKKNNSDYKKLSIEGKVNKLLGDPKSKAVNDSDINPDENFVDNIRHASAGRYTQEAISSRFGGGVTGTIAGLIGSNLMGAAHEIRAVKRDKRPLGTKLRESGEDMFNNAVGSLVGALPTSAKSKTQTIYKASFGNLLPDGYVSTPKGKKSGLSDNLYYKDEKGNINKKY